MRKNKKTLALAILTACMLILGACGKSEEEKAVEEIYNNLDAEGQAAIDQMREEVAAYENGKTTESTESQENLPPVSLDEIMEKTHELSVRDTDQMFWEPQQRYLEKLIGNEDFYFLTAAEYDGSGTELAATYTYKDLNLDLSVTCSVTAIDADDISLDAKDIGAYKVWVENKKDIVGRPTTYIYMFIPSTIDRYNHVPGFKVLITVMQRDPNGREVNDEVFQEFVEKEYEFVTGQLEKMPAVESGTTDEETASEESVQGEIPYGNYICSENGKSADINIEDGEFDVIMFEDINTASGVEGMYDIVWIEGSIYSIELGDRFGTATIDTNGNIQVTASNDELKPYEGYYTKKE